MASSALTKGVRVLFALAGHEVDGLSPSELAQAARISASDATRFRKDLTELGLVEEVPGINGRYRLSPKLVQIARAHDAGIERSRSRLDETLQRYSRNPL